jgi:[protein-PII] uridylyltransferase
MADGTVLDRLLVHREDRPLPTDAEFWQGLEEDLVRSVQGELDLRDAIEEVARKRSRETAPALPHRREVTSVHIDNESSPEFSLLDVICWDRPGLLYELCRTLSEKDFNIEFAKISTRFGLAQDVFYVNDSSTGEKIEADERLASVRSALMEVAAEPQPSTA